MYRNIIYRLYVLKSILVLLAFCLVIEHDLTANEPEEPKPTFSHRLGLPPRSERSPEERKAYFQKIRDWYERDPSEWPSPTLDEGIEYKELAPISSLTPSPDYKSDKRKETLGKQLFFDPRLSGSGQIACASCHDPDLGWSDGRTTSFGHNRRQLKRNAPSIENIVFRKSLFWDGRAPSIEQQARDVLANSDEMHAADDVLVENLTSIPEYVESFREIFGIEKPAPEQVALALAAFERTVISSTTRFDRFYTGKHNVITDQELSGLHLFRTEARCLNCHNGPLFSDDKFHNIGLSQYGRRHEDLGRYEITGDPIDVGAFRTPMLRNVTKTGPYMHSGLFELEEVLRLYNAGMPNDRPRVGNPAPMPIKSPLIKPLGLNDQDMADVAAFLKTLDGSRGRIFPPKLPQGLQ